MKTIVKIVGIFIIALIGLIVALPFLIPVDLIFNQVSQAVEKTTGRTLEIRGEKNLSVFPVLKLELNDVHFANMAKGTVPDMASMQQLAVHIPYLSVLSGEFKLEKFVINEPNIVLEKLANGQANWQLFDNVKQAPTAETKSDGASASLPSDFDIALGEVAIYGGTFTYIDHATKQQTKLTELKLAIDLPSIRKPLSVNGSVTYMGEVFELETRLTTPEKVITGADFSLNTGLNSSLFTLDFAGDVAKSGTDFSGALDVKGDSVKQILTWQKVNLTAKDEAFNNFGFKGKMHFANNKLSLTELVATLDKLEITGKASVDLLSRLAVTADINLGTLNVNPYLPQTAEVAKSEDKQQATPIVWDDTELDLSPLSSLDANVKIRSTAFQVNEIKLGENQFTLNLKNGLAVIAMDKFSAYEGGGNGRISVNAKTKPYKIETAFDLSGIQAEPLLTDAAGFDKLMGKGQLAWQFKTQGVSQKQFINALNGQLGFSFADGAVKGANIAAMVRGAEKLIKGGSFEDVSLNQGFDEAQKTDFSELTGEFNFSGGVSNNNKLLLKSPLIRVTGEGAVELPQTNINYRLVTGIVNSIEGQGTSDTSTGFKIPIRIKGPFHDVSIKPDLGEAAKDKAKDKIKDKLKNLFG